MRESKTGFSSQCLLQSLPPLSGDNRLWVAYSGGLDSHVLLHALSALELECALHAVHVNHGLNPQADSWAEHCEKVCAELGVHFVGLQVDAMPKRGESPEAAARNARYRAITELLQPGDHLCTAHHQDDQAETLLLQLLRGAGPKGLAAMAETSPLGAAIQLRPLLNFAREELMTYAVTHGFAWVEDDSNYDTGFDRNFLRHKILPQLKQRWPSAAKTISRTSNICAEAACLLDQMALQDFKQVQGDSKDKLCIDALLKLDSQRQKNLVRYWIRLNGLPLPSEAKLRHVFADVIPAAEDKMPCVKWKGAEVRRYRGCLYAMPPQFEFDTQQIIRWKDSNQLLELPDGSRLKLLNNLATLDSQEITVRFRQGGELCLPEGGQHHKTLKQLFQELEIAPWRRAYVPLLYVGEELVNVIGVCACESQILNQNILNVERITQAD